MTSVDPSRCARQIVNYQKYTAPVQCGCRAKATTVKGRAPLCGNHLRRLVERDAADRLAQHPNAAQAEARILNDLRLV